MRSSGVVPNQPVHKLLIERFDIVSEQHTVLFDESVGNGAVEPFDLRVHLGTAREGMEVNNVRPSKKQLEMFGELTAIVGLHVRERYWGDRPELLHEIGRASR